MSKTIVIYHKIDLDGWMSAAIVKKWSIEEDFKIGKSEKFVGENVTFLGWDYGDKIPDLSSYNQVIIVDVAFSAKEMLNLSKRLAAKFIWIDHHESAINDSKGKYDGNFGLRDIKFAACELAWKHFFPNDKMPEIVRLLGMYDSFRHKGTDEEQKVLEFQYGARQVMSNYQECYDNLNQSLFFSDGLSKVIIEDEILKNGSVIYKYLCTEARQTYKKAFPIIFKITKPNKSVGFASYPYKFLCVNQERFNPINFGIDYHKDGYDGFACFWYKDSKWTWNLYSDNEKVDCSVIAKQYGGGGHIGAAGMVIDDLSEIF